MLQHNAETPLAELAEAVHLSNTPCWRRIQWLREKGYITRHVALVDPRKVNVGVTVFVAVKTNQHHQQWFAGLLGFGESLRKIVIDPSPIGHHIGPIIDHFGVAVLRREGNYGQQRQQKCSASHSWPTH